MPALMNQTGTRLRPYPLLYGPGSNMNFATVFESVPTEDVTALTQEVEELYEKVRNLESTLPSLMEASQRGVEERVIVLRTLTKERAKQEILQLFQDGNVHDYGDISERLSLDLQLVVEICNELEREGRIG